MIGKAHRHNAVAQVLQLVWVTGLCIHAKQAGVMVRGVESCHAVCKPILSNGGSKPAARVVAGTTVLAPLPKHALHHLQHQRVRFRIATPRSI